MQMLVKRIVGVGVVSEAEGWGTESMTGDGRGIVERRKPSMSAVVEGSVVSKSAGVP